MNIILWPTYYLPNIGGLEVMTHNLALALKAKGHNVLVIANHVGSLEVNEFVIDGIKVIELPFKEALIYQKLLLIKNIFVKLNHIFDEFKPDVVNVHGWFEIFCFYQTRMLEKRKIAVCITIHGLIEQGHYQTQACLKLWSMAGCVCTVSDALIPSLAEYGFIDQKCRTVYNGLPIPQSAPLPLSVAPPRLLMVGRLTEEKCFGIAFEAVHLLREKYPALKLTLVGGGVEYETLWQLKTSLGLHDAIEMVGSVHPSEVEAYIDAASVILVPSRYESFCLVALQAALRGRPVIASEVYGLKEVVAHEKTGLLIPPQDVALWAAAIDSLLSAPHCMQAMGEAAYQRAIDLFSIETTVTQYVSMYQEALEQTHG